VWPMRNQDDGMSDYAFLAQVEVHLPILHVALRLSSVRPPRPYRKHALGQI
jgi:hypothetical protein